MDAVQLLTAEGEAASHFHCFRSFLADWVIRWGMLPSSELQSIFFHTRIFRCCTALQFLSSTGGARKKLQSSVQDKT